MLISSPISRGERNIILDGRYNTKPIARVPKKAEWGVDRDMFRGVFKSTSTGYLIISYKEDLKNMARLITWGSDTPASNKVSGLVNQINAYLSQALDAGEGGVNPLHTPTLFRAMGYSFREVVDNKALWRSWGQSPDNPLRIIIFSNRLEAGMVNGRVTYQVASDFITGSPSDSDDISKNDDVLEPEPDSPRSGTGSSRDNEDERSNEGGKGMATEQPAEPTAMDAPDETADDIATAGGDQRSMDCQTASTVATALVNV